MANIAREGAEKRTQTTFKSDQVHVARPATDGSDGLLATGVSKTTAQRLLGNDQIGEIHGGGETTTVNLKSATVAKRRRFTREW
jgi:hypothetical protein